METAADPRIRGMRERGSVLKCVDGWSFHYEVFHHPQQKQKQQHVSDLINNKTKTSTVLLVSIFLSRARLRNFHKIREIFTRTKCTTTLVGLVFNVDSRARLMHMNTTTIFFNDDNGKR